MASSRSLCVVRWAAGIKTTSISALLVCQSGVESNLAWEHFDVQMIHFTQDPFTSALVGRDRTQDPKRRKKTVQWFGDLHMLESLEGKKPKIFQ